MAAVARWPVSICTSWPASTDSPLASYSTCHGAGLGAVEKAGITKAGERDNVTEVCRKHGFSHSVVHHQLGLSCNCVLRSEVCCLGAPCGPRPPSSFCRVTANTAPPKKRLEKSCWVMGFPSFISIGLKLLWPSQEIKQKAFNVPQYQRKSRSRLRLLTVLWGDVLQGKGPAASPSSVKK